MTADALIRSVTPADVPALKAIIDRSALFPSAMLDDMMASYFSGASAEESWLTVDAAGPLAICYYTPERMTQGTWNVLLIAVDPDHRGSGHGTALMQHVERAVLARGGHLLLVETSSLPSFAQTRAFYDSRGYVREALIRDFYAPGEDKIVFCKALPAA